MASPPEFSDGLYSRIALLLLNWMEEDEQAEISQDERGAERPKAG